MFYYIAGKPGRARLVVNYDTRYTLATQATQNTQGFKVATKYDSSRPAFLSQCYVHYLFTYTPILIKLVLSVGQFDVQQSWNQPQSGKVDQMHTQPGHQQSEVEG